MSARYSYDGEADALYVYLNGDLQFGRTIEVIAASIMVDVAADGRVIGVEILSPRPGMDLSTADHHGAVDAIRKQPPSADQIGQGQ